MIKVAMREIPEEKFPHPFSWLGTSLSGHVFVLVNNRISWCVQKEQVPGPVMRWPAVTGWPDVAFQLIIHIITTAARWAPYSLSTGRNEFRIRHYTWLIESCRLCRRYTSQRSLESESDRSGTQYVIWKSWIHIVKTRRFHSLFEFVDNGL